MLLFCSCQFLTSDFSFCIPAEILLKNDSNSMFSLSFPFVLPWADLPTQLLWRGPDLRAVLGAPNAPSLVTKVAPSGHSHLKQPSTSYQKILCFNKAFSRTNHAMVRCGGGAEHPWAWVYRTPHQLCTSSLFCSIAQGTTGLCICGRRGKRPLTAFLSLCWKGCYVREPFQQTSKVSITPCYRWSSESLSSSHAPGLSGMGQSKDLNPGQRTHMLSSARHAASPWLLSHHHSPWPPVHCSALLPGHYSPLVWSSRFPYK